VKGCVKETNDILCIVVWTAVNSAMPALLERHISDVNATEQLRRERQLDSRDVVRSVGATSDSDDNAADDNQDAAATSAGEKQKRIVAPRKKFEWTLEIRWAVQICVTLCKFISCHCYVTFTSTGVLSWKTSLWHFLSTVFTSDFILMRLGLLL